LNILVTGGAGLIGSHLCESLAKKGHEIIIFDNFSYGSKKNIKSLLHYEHVQVIKGDCRNLNNVKDAVKDAEVVFHLAANPDVRLSSTKPEIFFEQNIYATYRLLEGIRKNSKIHTIVFTSTSTVYGEATKIPTPEDYSPLIPISIYGASKLACEALISAYAKTYDKNAIILRLANIIGERSTHGILYDFVRKLKNNSSLLNILGDGTQKKSYLYISDCVNAIETAWKRARNQIEFFNIGSEDQVSVRKIAEIVVSEMGLENVKLIFSGGVDGGRGWKGDVKNMLLDISKIKRLGWKPKYNSAEAIRVTIKRMIR